MHLLVILSPIVGTPEIAGVLYPFRPFLGPSKVRAHVATFDFISFCAEPQRAQGLRSRSAPFSGPKKARVM